MSSPSIFCSMIFFKDVVGFYDRLVGTNVSVGMVIDVWAEVVVEPVPDA